ncbi:MAG TPA: 4-carboxy-4-hydroxy-2-oxoadipate aldolase/oxaloacetate decarboxylase [Actinophytocola sp.]|jgi:4-hydroxy-4-methyl-2-oxoglutarate aldolase|nr:4-carboxy-4-hydroxy-2-oxoadipate aldolase/oxaloacetate decarboxylase [Actinophytocola sp.]
MPERFHADVPRPDPALAARLAEYDVTTLHEAHKAMGGWTLLGPELRCVPDGASCVGVAVTGLLVEGDVLGSLRCLATTRPGDVMVLNSVQGTGNTGMFGELMAVSAKARGVAGVVANGTVRDIAALRRHGVPVWHRGVNPAGMVRDRFAGVNVPIAFGGVIVNPGDLVVADADGVLILAPADVPEVLERAEARRAREAEMLPRLEAGGSPYDLPAASVPGGP